MTLETLFYDDSSPIIELYLSSSLYFYLMSPSSSKLDERMCYGDRVLLGETYIKFFEALGFRLAGLNFYFYSFFLIGVLSCCFYIGLGSSLDYYRVGDVIIGDYLPSVFYTISKQLRGY